MIKYIGNTIQFNSIIIENCIKKIVAWDDNKLLIIGILDLVSVRGEK